MPKKCCDGTGWTGTPSVLCVEHYQQVGDYFEFSHADIEEEPG